MSASSLSFSPEIKHILPAEVLEKHRILPMGFKHNKLCMIARRPLSDNALLELKDLTGYEDFELQLVGEDVLTEYISRFKSGLLFDVHL